MQPFRDKFIAKGFFISGSIATVVVMSLDGQMKLSYPIEPYQVGGDFLKFGDKVRRKFGLWAYHLGDDVIADPGVVVKVVGDGEVVVAEMKLGSEEHRSWGGVVIVRHESFYSIYGHMRNLVVEVGDTVSGGDQLGVVADSYTPENGWWKVPHLHFAIYTGPWNGGLLPGYWRVEKFWRTKQSWWHNPSDFLDRYPI